MPRTTIKPKMHIPCQVVPLGDGSFRLIPGEPVEEVGLEQAMHLLGLSAYGVRRLVEQGHIPASRPSPRRWVFRAADIHAFIEKTRRNPWFWEDLGEGENAKLCDAREKTL